MKMINNYWRVEFSEINQMSLSGESTICTVFIADII